MADNSSTGLYPDLDDDYPQPDEARPAIPYWGRGTATGQQQPYYNDEGHSLRPDAASTAVDMPSASNNFHQAQESYPDPDAFASGPGYLEERHPFLDELQGNVPNELSYLTGTVADDGDAYAEGVYEGDSDETNFLPDERTTSLESWKAPHTATNSGQPLDGRKTRRAQRSRKLDASIDRAESDYEISDDANDSLESDDDNHVSGDELEMGNDAGRERRPSARGRGRGRGRPRGRRGAAKAMLKRIDAGLGIPQTGPGRRRRRGRGRGRGSKHDDDRERKDWAVGSRPGPRPALAPSAELQEKLAKATEHFINDEFDAARTILEESILANPEQPRAHSLLGEVLAHQGETERAAMAFMFGAIANPREPGLWRTTADLIVSQAGTDSSDRRTFAIFATTKALQLEPADKELRLRRAELFVEDKKFRRAVNDYQMILAKTPCDPDCLEAVGTICLQQRWPKEAIALYAAALPSSHSHDRNDQCSELTWDHVNQFADLQLRAGTTIEGLKVLKQLARLILGRKDETFWDEVSDDREFDHDDEPRRNEVPEFVPGTHPLESYGTDMFIDVRMKLGFLRLRLGPEHLDEAKNHFAWFPLPHDEIWDPEYASDNQDVYTRVAGNLFATEHYSEALLYYEALRYSITSLLPIHLRRLALCYERCKLYDEAEEVLSQLAEKATNDMVYVERLAAMFTNAALPDRAEPYTQRLIEERRKKIRLHDRAEEVSPLVLSIEDDDCDPEKDYDHVPSVEEEQEEEDDDDEDEDAIPLPEAGLPEDLREQLDRIGLVEADAPSRPGRKQRRIARRPFSELDAARIQTLHAELLYCEQNQELDREVRGCDWLDTAVQLISEFKKQKVFYPSSANFRFWGYTHEAKQRAQLSVADQAALMSSVEKRQLEGIEIEQNLQIPEDFAGIRFERWFDIFFIAGILLARKGSEKEAFDVCDSMSAANIFSQHPDRSAATLNLKLVCALIVQDDEKVAYVARDFMKDRQFSGDAYRLYSAAHLALPQPNFAWNSAVNQKFMLRQIKAMDKRVQTGSVKKAHADSSQSPTRIEKPVDEDSAMNKLTPELLLLYGQLMYAGNGHVEALSYFYRTHALTPEDPLVNLLLALSYLGWAFKRQSFNRHYLVTQGLAMFDRYKELRMDGSDVAKRQEIEFNQGRLFQTLGLLHLSVDCYEKCLALAEDLKGAGGDEGFTKEAAYALKGIWAMSGQTKKAEELVERWLVM